MALDNGPVDYRQLQGPEQLMSAASVPTSGRASEAEELSQSLKQFSSSAGQLADKAESQAGAIADQSNRAMEILQILNTTNQECEDELMKREKAKGAKATHGKMGA